ncbi:MAG: hypothetical protein LBH08_02470 [Puniceicoccales bacterium]|nr:hypothetical protein [Puniceicoccales bacterium]
MKKVYATIEPPIIKYKRAKNAFVTAYGEYSERQDNAKNDIRNQQSWPYLDMAAKYYEKYDNHNKNSQQSSIFSTAVLLAIRSAGATR